MKMAQEKEAVRPLSLLIYAGLIAAFLTFRVSMGMAATTAEEATEETETSTTVETTEVDMQESYFDNPAQAAHAAQLADQNVDVQAAFSDVQDAEKDLADAEKALKDLDLEVATDVEIAVAEKEVQDKKDALEAAETNYGSALGIETGAIADMRASGMGWGEIAHELGVHPGSLGLGHKNRERNRLGTDDELNAEVISDVELAEATARNPKTGNAKGHGQGLHTSADTPGTGLETTALASATKTKSEKGKSSNVSSSGGLGSGKGNSSSSSGSGQGSSSGSSSGNSGNSGKGDKGGNSGNSGGNSGKGGGNDKDGNNGGGNGGGKGGGNGGGKK